MSAILSETNAAIDGEMSVEQAKAVVSAYAATFDAIISVGGEPHHYSHHDVLNAALLVLLGVSAAKRSIMHVAFELICETCDNDDGVEDAIVAILINELGVELTFAFARRAALAEGGAA